MSSSTDIRRPERPAVQRATARHDERTSDDQVNNEAAEAHVQTAARPRDLSSESFSAFTEVLSHRMGNLLSGIEGYTDLLLPGLDTSEDRETAFRILEGVSRMSGILKDLRHYQEALDVRPHTIEAEGILSKLMPLLADSEAARLRIDSTIRPGFHVRIDERLIRQALLSILRNAFEALSSEHEPVSLRADYIDQGQTVRFRIHSTSSIVDPEIRRRLFEPFFTTKSANLGLGLTMARRIFRAHGGDVTLSSTDMEMGTEFTCTIPRHN